MGEVNVKVDQEAACQDVSMEPLPEPLLIILAPPPPFLPVPGKPTMSWHKWLKAFQQYIQALGENELNDSSKCALLQNCLGPEGQHVFAALIPKETTFSTVISVLTAHFSSNHTLQSCRLQFHHRAQMPGETVVHFVSALKDLLRPCNYEDLQDTLILDQLIEKTSCPQLRERLQLERDTLTLEQALAISKEVESLSESCALSESQLFGIHEVSVNIEDDLDPPVQKKAKRGRPRRGEARGKAPTKAQTTPHRYKDDFYYADDKQYYSDEDQHLKTVKEESHPDCKSTSEAANNNSDMSTSALKTEVGSCQKANGTAATDDVEDDECSDDEEDDGSLPSPTKLERPCCPLCGNKGFRNAYKLARHMRTHTKEKPFSCPRCPLTFSQSYHMTRHMRNQHGAGLHVCYMCGETLGSYAELQGHRKAHTSQVLSCLVCPGKFSKSGELKGHVVSHYEDNVIQADGPTSAQSSELEGQEFIPSGTRGDENEERNVNALENHAAFGVSDPPDKGCVKTEDKDTEGDRQDGVGPKPDEASRKKNKEHFCPICVGRHFRGPNKLARHMRTHTKEKPFSCPVCTLSFSQSYHMSRHLRKQHNLGQYICAKCGKNFNSWLELQAHKKTHSVKDLTCLACGKQFKEKAALVSHLRVHQRVRSSSPRSLICSDCGKQFGRMYHLKRHIVTHHKDSSEEGNACPDCHKKFAFPEDLSKHLEIHVKENNGTCPKCNMTFGSPEELQTHVRLHETSYSCKTCGKTFKVEYAHRKHEQGHQNERSHRCSVCCKHFFKLSHYKRHLMVHGRRESKCPHCESVFLTLTALKYHLRTHTEERPYQCTCCIETFKGKEELELHCLKHRKFKKERPYSCARCDYAFSTLGELTEHMSSHEGEQPLSCPVCGKTFLNKNKLEKHLSIHTGERPHLCSICGNGFPSAASLKLHSTMHTGEKPFQCPQCVKSFRTSSGLRLHSRQHMEVRPSYKCHECGRTYGRMTELKMHQRYHTGDKPYACTCCSKRFVRKDKLNVHMRMHTGERPYSCLHCGQTFTQSGDRNRHIAKVHSDAGATQAQ